MFKKVVITGVTGFIGGALARKLLMDGVTVYGVGRDRKRLDVLSHFENFVPVQADFDQYNNLHKLIDDKDFDMFWHFAWQGTSAATYNDCCLQYQNVKTACDAAMAAVSLNCKKIGVSGSYYQYCNININSTDKPFNPVAYGAVKSCVLDLYKSIAYKAGIDCTNTIVPNAFGVGDKLNTAIVFFIKKLLCNEPLNLISGVNPDDWIDIDDLTSGIICAATSGKKYTDYYIGHSNITTFKEKIMAMRDILSSDSELLFGTYPETYIVDYRQIDSEALYRDTAFEPQNDFVESITKTTSWIKSFKII